MTLGQRAYESAIREQLERWPWLSDRAVARRLGIGQPTVGRYRKALGIERLKVPRMDPLNQALGVWGMAVQAQDYDLRAMADRLPTQRMRLIRATTARAVAAVLLEYADVLAPPYRAPSEAGNVNQDRGVGDG
jgi:hypothetical protein